MQHEDGKILGVHNLRVVFNAAGRKVYAVRDISFELKEGAVTALVGESGCGKSVTALALGGLLPRGKRSCISGRFDICGVSVDAAMIDGWRKIRGRLLAYVFQDPSTALNPVMRIGRQVAEALPGGNGYSSSAVQDLLMRVRLPDVHAILDAWPHELSGGMQQRVMLAMAVAANPRILIADEPTTALDVTVQAQIMQLLDDLRKETGMSVLLITHNLGLVADVAEDVIVMYAGQLVEKGPVERVLQHPCHPYTRGLLAAVPSLDKNRRAAVSITGSVPDLCVEPSGCAFADRCPLADEDCRIADPDWTIDGKHAWRCFKSRPQTADREGVRGQESAFITRWRARLCRAEDVNSCHDIGNL